MPYTVYEFLESERFVDVPVLEGQPMWPVIGSGSFVAVPMFVCATMWQCHPTFNAQAFDAFSDPEYCLHD